MRWRSYPKNSIMRFPLKAKLKDGTPIELVLVDRAHVEAFQNLYALIVEEGNSYPHQHSLDQQGIWDYWFEGKSTIGAFLTSPRLQSELVGGFYLKPNWPGRARRIANAGFMVAPGWRNKGLGWLLGATMLGYAKFLGYHGVIFNLVFTQNQIARSLWIKLGFAELGIIPSAIANDDGTYQDGIIMFRSLADGTPLPGVGGVQ